MYYKNIHTRIKSYSWTCRSYMLFPERYGILFDKRKNVLAIFSPPYKLTTPKNIPPPPPLTSNINKCMTPANRASTTSTNIRDTSPLPSLHRRSSDNNDDEKNKGMSPRSHAHRRFASIERSTIRTDSAFAFDRFVANERTHPSPSSTIYDIFRSQIN